MTVRLRSVQLYRCPVETTRGKYGRKAFPGSLAIMPRTSDLQILIVCCSISEASRLLILTSPLTKNVVSSTDYKQGLALLRALPDTGQRLVFLGLPPDSHTQSDAAVEFMAAAFRKVGPHRTILVAADHFPSRFSELKIEDPHVIHKPVTRDKLAGVLEPLGITLPRLNCWEFTGCGREPGGVNADTLGVCPAAVEDAASGLHGGRCGGRACWAITGTLCGGKVQGTFASKMGSCLDCDFYKLVKHEEGFAFESIDSILNRLRRKKQGGV